MRINYLVQIQKSTWPPQPIMQFDWLIESQNSKFDISMI